MNAEENDGAAGDGNGQGGAGADGCGCENFWFRSSDDVRKGYVRGIEDRQVRSVKYSVIDNMAIFEGDIALGTVSKVEGMTQLIDNPPVGKDGRVLESIAISGLRFRWPGGRVPWTSIAPLRGLVLEAIAHWEARTPIRFIERTTDNAKDHPDYVSFQSLDGCWSEVGMQGGEQVISLGDGCGFGQAVHEIAHAVGLWHEQSREDRGQHVRIMRENIKPGREHNFDQHIVDGDDVGAYDYDSIMHYGQAAFSIDPAKPTIVAIGGQTIGQRNGLSAGDIEAIRKLYPS